MARCIADITSTPRLLSQCLTIFPSVRDATTEVLEGSSRSLSLLSITGTMYCWYQISTEAALPMLDELSIGERCYGRRSNQAVQRDDRPRCSKFAVSEDFVLIGLLNEIDILPGITCSQYYYFQRSCACDLSTVRPKPRRSCFVHNIDRR